MASFLLVTTGAIALEAIQRLVDPGEVSGAIVMIVAAAAIVVNGLSAWLLLHGQAGDLNIRGAFLHLIGDAATSASVVLAGAVILFTRWNWVDPLVSLTISVAIVWASWGLLSEAASLSLHAVPTGIDPDQVRDFLARLSGVSEVHDLHIWALSTKETALTAHLVMPSGHEADGFLLHVCEALQKNFSIGHATIQVENDAASCKLAPEHVI